MNKDKESVLVPVDWLVELSKLAEQAQKDLGLGDEFGTSSSYELSQIRLKVAPLVGYARSAKYLTTKTETK